MSLRVLKKTYKSQGIKRIASGEASAEKAGVGGSTPSLATILSITYDLASRPLGYNPNPAMVLTDLDASEARHKGLATTHSLKQLATTRPCIGHYPLTLSPM